MTDQDGVDRVTPVTWFRRMPTGGTVYISPVAEVTFFTPVRPVSPTGGGTIYRKDGHDHTDD